ncbi:MAG: hypothetical protein AABX17_03020, partial [Nanoarchaeota archaeon]
MSVEEVMVGLKNALARGQTIEKATQSLILAGYNVQEVQEAVRQTNLGVIGNIGVVGETNNKNTPEFKKLPTENVQQKPDSDWDSQAKEKTKKPIPKWLIVSIISVGVLLLILLLLGVFGRMILKAFVG